MDFSRLPFIFYLFIYLFIFFFLSSIKFKPILFVLFFRLNCNFLIIFIKTCFIKKKNSYVYCTYSFNYIYRNRKIPIIIRRYLPDGSYEDWGVDELIITEWSIRLTEKHFFTKSCSILLKTNDCTFLIHLTNVNISLNIFIL